MSDGPNHEAARERREAAAARPTGPSTAGTITGTGAVLDEKSRALEQAVRTEQNVMGAARLLVGIAAGVAPGLVPGGALPREVVRVALEVAEAQVFGPRRA